MELQTGCIETGKKLVTKGVDIGVIAKDKPGGGIDWSLDIKTSGHGNGNKLDLPPGETYKLTFKLDDETRIGLRFDASAPIFVREGGPGTCPTSITTPQVMVDSCDSDTLEVVDWNFGAAVDLYYQLNFVTKDGLNKHPYDPDIRNGGGGIPPFMLE